jgi:anti-sigma B factor antagonist
VDVAITIEDAPQGCIIVQICGELDISTVPDVRERLLAILNRTTPSRLILDLSKLEFMDSSGVAVLVNTERRARLLGGTVVLAAPQRSVSRVLQICGMNHYFSIFNDVSAAVIGRQADLPQALHSGCQAERGGTED